MLEKLNAEKFALAGGIAGIALSAACAAAVFSAPQASMGLFASLIHSSIPITPKAFEAGSVITGLIAAAAIGAFIAGVFALAYNKLGK